MKDQDFSTNNHAGLSDDVVDAAVYITPFPAIAILLLPRNSERPTLRFHACQSLLLNFAVLIFVFILNEVVAFATLLSPFPDSHFSWMTGLIWTCRLGWTSTWCLCAVATLKGKRLKLPIIGTLAERWTKPSSRRSSMPTESTDGALSAPASR
jgi:uncharacterized membrane protein